MLKKKLLLIAPSYMGYGLKIKKAFSQDFFVFSIIDNKDTERKIIKYSKDFFDIIVVIRGDSLSQIQDFIENAKAERKILYEWDSLNNFNYAPYVHLFDIVKTFDMKDAEEMEIGYLPLFFSKVELSKTRNIDMLFVGIWHSDRQILLQKFYKILKSNKKTVYFRLYYKWYYYLPFELFSRNVMVYSLGSSFSRCDLYLALFGHSWYQKGREVGSLFGPFALITRL